MDFDGLNQKLKLNSRESKQLKQQLVDLAHAEGFPIAKAAQLANVARTALEAFHAEVVHPTTRVRTPTEPVSPPAQTATQNTLPMK